MSAELDDVRQLYQAARQPRRLKAVIADMDGSLVNVSSIRHYVSGPVKDFDAFHAASRHCPPNEQALEFCRRHYAAGEVIAVVTARMERHYETSAGWLDDYLLPELLAIPRALYLPVGYDGPIMRPDGLTHSDVSVKRRIYRYLTRHYEIVAACDDNPSILPLWEEMGIPEIERIPGWEED
jgi:hypothetical protein